MCGQDGVDCIFFESLTMNKCVCPSSSLCFLPSYHDSLKILNWFAGKSFGAIRKDQYSILFLERKTTSSRLGGGSAISFLEIIDTCLHVLYMNRK